MRSARGLYSLIQYRPDESRLEAINIGVVLFCAELGYLSARWAGSARARIQRVFEAADWAFIESEVNAVQERLSHAGNISRNEDFVRYAETRANWVVLTAPRFVKVEGDPAALIDALFQRLVGEETPSDPRM